jgi:hypothetical protein
MHPNSYDRFLPDEEIWWMDRITLTSSTRWHMQCEGRHFSVISAQLLLYSNIMFPSFLTYSKFQWRILLLKLTSRNSELSLAANCHGLCIIWQYKMFVMQQCWPYIVLWCNLFPVPHASRQSFMTLLNCFIIIIIIIIVVVIIIVIMII